MNIICNRKDSLPNVMLVDKIRGDRVSHFLDVVHNSYQTGTRSLDVKMKGRTQTIFMKTSLQ